MRVMANRDLVYKAPIPADGHPQNLNRVMHSLSNTTH